MSDQSQDDLLHVELNYASVSDDAPSAFEFPHVTRLSTGRSLFLSPHVVPVHDLRKAAKRPTLEVEGFAWQTIPYDGLDGDDGWQDKYEKDTCEWLRKYVGAKECVPINSQIRRRTPVGDAAENYSNDDDKKVLGHQPAAAVHVDINRERCASRILTAFGPDSGYSADDHLAIINIWRPLRGPVMDAPLAVCDARTLDPADMDRTTDLYGGGYFIKYNANMKWMYIRDQMPEDILIFRQYDNTMEPKVGDAACIAHTAFIDEERKSMGLPRESVELRCALVY